MLLGACWKKIAGSSRVPALPSAGAEFSNKMFKCCWGRKGGGGGKGGEGGGGGGKQREREREDGWKRGSERKRRRGGRGGGEGGGGVGGERGRRVSERYVNYVKWLYTSVVVLCRWWADAIRAFVCRAVVSLSYILFIIVWVPLHHLLLFPPIVYRFRLGILSPDSCDWNTAMLGKLEFLINAVVRSGWLRAKLAALRRDLYFVPCALLPVASGFSIHQYSPWSVQNDV